VCTHYGTAKVTGSGMVPSIQTMASKLLQSDIVKEQYPNLLTLLTISLTLPVSSVDCERGFSKHNLIKTRTRGRLKTDHVATLMKMSLDTPELSTCLDAFDFKRAFVIWCNMKDRLICRVYDFYVKFNVPSIFINTTSRADHMCCVIGRMQLWLYFFYIG
jgi:hypothetical protein